MNAIDIRHASNSKTDDDLNLLFTQLPIKLISSESLFGMGSEVLIQHRDKQYHLRLTRNDKLILTK
ncbi:MAG TPA: hemin uptake protein HemP [Nitrosomonas halophila]|nr:hemin uptake protein HemP [Nitrosomonas halophila]